MEVLKKTLIDNYFNFQGRATAVETIVFLIFSILTSIVISIALAVANANDNTGLEKSIHLLDFLINTLLLVPSLSLYIRRLHDLDKSGWWILIVFTIIGLIPFFYWIYMKAGNPDSNEYGEAPLL